MITRKSLPCVGRREGSIWWPVILAVAYQLLIYGCGQEPTFTETRSDRARLLAAKEARENSDDAVAVQKTSEETNSEALDINEMDRSEVRDLLPEEIAEALDNIVESDLEKALIEAKKEVEEMPTEEREVISQPLQEVANQEETSSQPQMPQSPLIADSQNQVKEIADQNVDDNQTADPAKSGEEGGIGEIDPVVSDPVVSDPVVSDPVVSDPTNDSDEQDNTNPDTQIPKVDEPPLDYVAYSQVSQQKELSKVDILWVVDVSGSMSEEQTYLGNNFSAFIEALANKDDVSVQTAITNTDVCDDEIPADLSKRACPVEYGGSASTHLRGSFIGENTRKVLFSTDVDFVEKFKEYTKLGVDGSGFEHGSYAAKLAVEKALNGGNESLIRDDAFLSVIIVSDEEDDGIGLAMKDAFTGYNFFEMGLTTFKYTSNDLINYLKAVKGNGRFAISTITGTKNADGTLCTSPHSEPKEEGTAYIQAAANSGGIVQSICETNWNESLTNMGHDLSAQITQIPLDHNAFVPSIKVYINGIASTDWVYIEANNSIRFQIDAIPAPGSEIKVEYYGMP